MNAWRVIRLRTLLALSPPERCALLRVAALVAVLRLGLGAVPVRTLRYLLAQASPAVLPRFGSAEGCVRAVRRVSAHVPGATCLVQALAVEALFRRLDLPSRLCMGVGRSNDGRLLGHAWVEYQGRAVIGEGLPPRYARLPLDPSERSTT